MNRAHEIWEKIYAYKDEYIRKSNAASWNSFIGNTFQNFVHSIIKNVFRSMKTIKYGNIGIFTEEQVKKNPALYHRILLDYGNNESALPDIDSVVADYDFANPKKTVIIAILSCKTSLRERIAQACYWKIKLKQSPKTKHVKVYLVTADNDHDFELDEKGEKTRDRIIAEHELDGVYVLKGDFKQEWESDKVKRYEKLFTDLF